MLALSYPDIHTTPTLDPIALVEKRTAPMKKAKWHLGTLKSLFVFRNITR